LFALTWQPLPRSGQPEAAMPGSWTRVAWAPGTWACMQGGPPLENGAIVFSGAFRAGGGAVPRPGAGAVPRPGTGPVPRPDCGPDGVDAAFMLLERGVGWLAGAAARAIWGAGRASVTVASPVPRLTTWMPRSCCKSCMNAATMSYGRADRTSRRGISGYGSSPGAQGHQRKGLGRLLGARCWGLGAGVPWGLGA
jgi:hypothetical protein